VHPDPAKTRPHNVNDNHRLRAQEFDGRFIDLTLAAWFLFVNLVTHSSNPCASFPAKLGHYRLGSMCLCPQMQPRLGQIEVTLDAPHDLVADHPLVAKGEYDPPLHLERVLLQAGVG
jgi:hypothetical protein